MWNTTEDCCDMEPVETTASIDEAAYSILYGTYNPGSPAYSGNLTDFGISVGMLKFCMEGIGITSLAIFGILGNILSIVVLCSSKMKNSSSCFLLFLAICDMCTLLGAALLVGIPSILSYYPTDNPDDNMFIFNENIVKYVNIVPIGEILMITTVGKVIGEIMVYRYNFWCFHFCSYSLSSRNGIHLPNHGANIREVFSCVQTLLCPTPLHMGKSHVGVTSYHRNRIPV